MRIAKLKLTAAVVVATGIVVLAGVGTGYALSGNAPPIDQLAETGDPSKCGYGR